MLFIYSLLFLITSYIIVLHMSPHDRSKKLAKESAPRTRRLEHSVIDPLTTARDIGRSAANLAFVIASYPVEKSIEGLNKTQEIISQVIPQTGPKRAKWLSKRVRRAVYGFLYPAEADNRTPYERALQSEQHLTLEDGRRVTVRAVREADRETLAKLYSEGINQDDRYMRFMAMVTGEYAAREVLARSSLGDDPSRYTDIVGVTDDGTVIAHAGYALYGDADQTAEPHVVVHRDWRRGKRGETGVADGVFCHTLTLAQLDPRVEHLEIHTHCANSKVQKLIDASTQSINLPTTSGYDDSERIFHVDVAN